MNSGYGSIQILITLAILGLLFAIGLPQFNHYRDRAYSAALAFDRYRAYIDELK